MSARHNYKIFGLSYQKKKKVSFTDMGKTRGGADLVRKTRGLV